MKQKTVKKQEATSDPKLRSQNEINQEYTNFATQFGDKFLKRDLLNRELDAIHARMMSLSAEPAAKETAAV